MKKMVKYCKQDVKLLEKVYLKLRPYMKGHPVISDDHAEACPRCNSYHLHKVKVRQTASGLKYQQYQCQGCGGYFQAKKALPVPDKPLMKS